MPLEICGGDESHYEETEDLELKKVLIDTVHFAESSPPWVSERPIWIGEKEWCRRVRRKKDVSLSIVHLSIFIQRTNESVQCLLDRGKFQMRSYGKDPF